jgi:uncharacterized membrane protein
MPETPDWALLLSFWLHMLATVAWIGGLAGFTLFVFPLARRRLSATNYAELLEASHQRLSAIGWISLAVLTVTGLVQMSANPNYEGVLAFSNPWARAILVKHLAFVGMIATSAYQTWGLAPSLARAALRRAHGETAAEEQVLQRRQERLTRLNLGLGVLILVFTALARIA